MRQEEVLAGLAQEPQASLPGPVLVFGVAGDIGSAMVFNAGYDLPNAVRVRRPGTGLSAFLAGEGRARWQADGVVFSSFPSGRLEYRGLRAYCHDTRSWHVINGPQDLAALPCAKGA